MARSLFFHFMALIICVSATTASCEKVAGIKPLESLTSPSETGSPAQNAPSASSKDTLSGGYIGLTASAAHVNMKIDQTSLAGSGPFGGVVIGGGRKVRKAYISGELDVNYGSFLSTKKGYGKVSGHMDMGVNVRVGYADKNKTIPYLKMGFGWTDYKLKTNGLKKKFNAIYFSPGIGLEIPILSASFLRLEASYAMNLGNKDLKGHTFQSKPSRIVFKAGGFTRF